MKLTPQPDYAAAPSTSARASGETLIAGPCQPCPPPRWSPLHGGRLIRELAGSISERLVCKQAGGSSVTRVTKGGFPCHYIHRSTPSPVYIILYYTGRGCRKLLIDGCSETWLASLGAVGPRFSAVSCNLSGGLDGPSNRITKNQAKGSSPVSHTHRVTSTSLFYITRKRVINAVSLLQTKVTAEPQRTSHSTTLAGNLNYSTCGRD